MRARSQRPSFPNFPILPQPAAPSPPLRRADARAPRRGGVGLGGDCAHCARIANLLILPPRPPPSLRRPSSRRAGVEFTAEGAMPTAYKATDLPPWGFSTVPGAFCDF